MYRLPRWATGLLACLAVLLLVAGTAAAVPADRVLVVEQVETGETLVVTPVENSTTVTLVYTHSVEQSRVADEYTVRGDRLEMTRMTFESYGWGLPASADVTRENGSFVFDPDGSVRELTVKPGRIAGHRLHVGDRTYDLVALSDANAVRLDVQRQSTLDTALRRLI